MIVVPIVAAVLGAAGLTYGVIRERTATPGSDEAPGTSSPSSSPSIVTTVTSTLAAAVNPTLRNRGVLPTPEQRTAVLAKYRRFTGTIVPRVVTPYPDAGPNGTNLAAFAAMCAVHAGSPSGGAIMAVLASIETWAGIRPSGRLAVYNHNAGNQKLPRSAQSTGEVWFIVDGVRSIDLYPSFPDWPHGIERWYRLLTRPHYNRTNYRFALPSSPRNANQPAKGAVRALREGDIVAFNAALGNGEYADSYQRVAFMNARADRLMRMGSLPRGIIRL